LTVMVEVRNQGVRTAVLMLHVNTSYKIQMRLEKTFHITYEAART
jgi:hypothetical protein